MRIPFRNLKPHRGSLALWVPITALLTLATAASLSACGSSSDSSTAPSSLPSSILDTKTVEKAIGESIFEQRHVHATVTCPSVVPQEQGRTFVCIASVGNKKTPFVVEETNNSGHVTYHAK